MQTVRELRRKDRGLWTAEFVIAERIAVWRATPPLKPFDILSGIYLAAWERLSRAWRAPENFEQVMAEECGLDLPRWCYLADFSRSKSGSYLAPMTREAARILRAAERIANSRYTASRGPADVRCEDFILALVARDDLRIARLLRGSSLDTSKLQPRALTRRAK